MLVPKLSKNSRYQRSNSSVKIINMAYKTPTGRTIYQWCGSNSGRGFGWVHKNLYRKGWGRGFNPTKLKVRGKYESLGSNVYQIGDSRQAEKYTKMMEVILNYTKGNFKKRNDVKESLEELNNFDFNIIEPETPYSITLIG